VREVSTGKAAEEAGKLLNVSARHVQTTKRLKRKHPKKYEARKSGNKTVSQTKKEVDCEERAAQAVTRNSPSNATRSMACSFPRKTNAT
jgi:hypothetical protein